MITTDDQPPDDLLDAIDADPPAAPGDKLDQLRSLCEELRDVEYEIQDLTARIELAQARRTTLRAEVIPDKMDQCAVGAIDLLSRGNYPAARVEVKPEVYALIAAKWDDSRKKAAFDWLESDGSGDLIKTTLVANFPREQRKKAVEIMQTLIKIVPDLEIKESVHGQTLSAWLRERIKRPKKNSPVPLDVIGGFVGRVADVKVAGVKK